MKLTENVETYLQKKRAERSEQFEKEIKNRIEERSKLAGEKWQILDMVG